ncbi:hypothetical protein [Pedobacter caeni]|uniref:Uncharacterized protein n=1 Tax=Pedobacter caeni TaxID=288992 RepID=A0A1M4SYA1_9SPHI|nr:hypothetical protein [Pedobacter caeni]SHE37171.1 hypothetical protein SAMN04488522_10112 [Pedobacter caeni]
MVDYSDVMMNRVVAVKGYTSSVTLGVEAVKELMKAPTKKY